MKRNRSVAKASEPAKGIQRLTLSDQAGDKLSVESNLSPERLLEGTSMKTALLSQILAQQESSHQLRDWGINE